MRNRWIAILAAGSVLTGEAISVVDKHGCYLNEADKQGCYWLAPDHIHIEKPEGDPSGSGRSISVDSGAATATTGSLDLFERVGVHHGLIVS
jgi:hypothetical protein